MSKGYRVCCPISTEVSPRLLPGHPEDTHDALRSETFQPTLTCDKVDLGERRPQMIFQKIKQSPESCRILQQRADIAAKRGRTVSTLLLSPGEAGSDRSTQGEGWAAVVVVVGTRWQQTPPSLPRAPLHPRPGPIPVRTGKARRAPGNPGRSATVRGPAAAVPGSWRPRLCASRQRRAGPGEAGRGGGGGAAPGRRRERPHGATVPRGVSGWVGE